ncbi:hypothetical protein HY496_02310 [Candidatus Woesearchaeota archaeon]|nr:hypothetical protein [Candidatus Woesearchaeota archaeon]
MIEKYLTLRRLEKSSLELFGGLVATDSASLKPEWTDEQIEEAYAQIFPLFGKKCVVMHQPYKQSHSYQGILKPADIAIGFFYYPERRPSVSLFSIEDLTILEKKPVPHIQVENTSRWICQPLHGLEALRAMYSLYFAGVRRPKTDN